MRCGGIRRLSDDAAAGYVANARPRPFGSAFVLSAKAELVHHVGNPRPLNSGEPLDRQRQALLWCEAEVLSDRRDYAQATLELREQTP